jgi:hypothetical protein
MKTQLWIPILASLTLGPAFAQMTQTNILVNGSFESGLAGWTQATKLDPGETGSCSYNGVVAPGTETVSGLAGFPATDGTRIVLGSATSTTATPDTTTQNAVNCLLYQDVTIPVGATMATWSIDIGTKSTVGTTLIGLYPATRIPTAASFSPSVAGYIIGWFGHAGTMGPRVADTVLYTQPAPGTAPSFDVSSLAGTTVRFAIINSLQAAGTSVIGIDNVRLLVTAPATQTPIGTPALSSWAMVGLGALLGCVGVLGSRVRTA